MFSRAALPTHSLAPRTFELFISENGVDLQTTLLFVLFGFTPWILLFYELFDVAVTLFSHSNVRLPAWLDRGLRYLIVTPDLHRVHHSSHQPETDSNYSAVFPIWDVLFRTFRTETREPQETMQLGLEEVRGAAANRFWWLLLSPLEGKLKRRRRERIQGQDRPIANELR
jgi:sterol desaturase/sphingolipid hydroxylase (fatty acid hydroxylase superfamily)